MYTVANVGRRRPPPEPDFGRHPDAHDAKGNEVWQGRAEKEKGEQHPSNRVS